MVQVIQVIQVVSVVRIISLDDVRSENIWFLWSTPSNYREKLRCHACDTRRRRKVEPKMAKIGQCSGRPETAKDALMQKPHFTASATTAAACALQKIKTKQGNLSSLTLKGSHHKEFSIAQT